MNYPIAATQKKSIWTELSQGSLPYIISQYLPHDRVKIILTSDSETAQRLCQAWQFFRPNDVALFLPDWETLPYEALSPHQDLVSERLSVLWRLKHNQVDVLFVPVATAMQRLAPTSFLLGHTFFLHTGQTIDIETLRHNLIQAGYTLVSNVMASGEFAVRGSIVDLFAMGSDTPYRIDLFDTEIDSIKTFDPDTQRTTGIIEEIRLLPAYEFPTDEAAQTGFRLRFREHISGDPMRATVYRAVSRGEFGAGVEYYLPLFFEQECASLWDYIDDHALVIGATDMEAYANRFWHEVKSRYTIAQTNEDYPPLVPSLLYISPDQWLGMVKKYPQIILQINTPHDLPALVVNRQAEQPLGLLQQFLHTHPTRLLICADSLGRRETMAAFFKQNGMDTTIVDNWQAFIDDDSPVAMTVAPLSQGFYLPNQFALVTENDLYQYTTPTYTRRKKHKAYADTALRDLAEINIGDPVVHEEHGIARYMGLVVWDNDELMQLDYADDAKLYVPVSQLHLISRYSGSASENVSLHKLGSGAWNKAKRKAAEQARDTAAELLNLYAQRAAQTGRAFDIDETAYQAFANGFAYEETEDQAAAIAAVLHDLSHSKPMDRLICGDVGFGKTEVALRAAFVVAMNGKQVAMLAPTTLLVEQHAQSFADRFAAFPIRVASLSRFNNSKQTQATLQGMAQGTVDIVIGTHKLVQDNIHFKNLGLVIIDEEHRFGVRQKEQLKRLRANVDMLTLTATPIPRTLSMALEGLRDFSLITTAPQRRLAVKTFVKPFGEGSVREAILRELKRGGQVFFLHNEVETIANMYEKLSQWLPEARIGIAHGQLRERELEQVMRDFLHQRYNVLLCSTIIETGIDIPNANTILINRADKFGIAQLHQLRGRVGRSHHQAYAYLFTPDYVTKDAAKRLDAIAAADELGAGFSLAMQDLEIRGAGEILGEGQSGEMAQVGLTLYTEMLKQAVRDLKKGRVPDLDAPLGINTEIKLHAPALLPEDYCPDVHERLVLYKRLASSETPMQIDQIQEELIDRFGLTPLPVKTLIASHRLRLVAKELGITHIDANASHITLTFGKHTSVTPEKLIALMQSQKNSKMVSANKLRFNQAYEDIEARIQAIRRILQALS